jgi:tRNA-2-methylthio-N6-dimethylallyladenosine synthase
VPSTRGREVSRDPHSIIGEAEALTADGVREVTLLGQNVNSYGRDLPASRRIGFSELLRRLDALPGLDRLRYTSPHPKDMRADVLQAHIDLPSLCEHIHLPLQAGSSRILKSMRRTYDRERYLDRVEAIRESVPDCSITTDIIVGFPGESERDFEETLELVDRVGFDAAFAFPFSPRRGTHAATLPGQISREVKSERMGRLVELVNERAAARAERFLGRDLEVLVEGPSRTDPTRVRGRTRHNRAVNFDGLAAPGELTEVGITDTTSHSLDGVEKLLGRAG